MNLIDHRGELLGQVVADREAVAREVYGRRDESRPGEAAEALVRRVQTCDLARHGVPAEAPGLQAVGYRELRACLEGRLDLPQALDITVRATRRFAKRQRTWFRREPGILWRHPEEERGRIGAEVEAFLRGETGPAAATT